MIPQDAELLLQVLLVISQCLCSRARLGVGDLPNLGSYRFVFSAVHSIPIDLAFASNRALLWAASLYLERPLNPHQALSHEAPIFSLSSCRQSSHELFVHLGRHGENGDFIKSRLQREWRSRKEQEGAAARAAEFILSLSVSNLELIGSREIRSFYIIWEQSGGRPATSVAHPGSSRARPGSPWLIRPIQAQSGGCPGLIRASPGLSGSCPDLSGGRPGSSGVTRGSSGLAGNIQSNPG